MPPTDPTAALRTAETLGEQVRRARQSAGVGLRELARRIDLSPSYVSDIEHDRRRPSEATWKALVLTLNLYGGALYDELADDLRREQPNVYAAVELRGMALGCRNTEAALASQADDPSEPDALDAERLALTDHTKSYPARCQDFGARDHEASDHLASARATIARYAALRESPDGE